MTYSIVVSNVGTADAPITFVADTLPSEVDFARWLDQPTGSSVNSDQITWNGTISTGQSITFTFVVTHVGNYDDVVTNTAQFDQANGSGSASAAFNVVTPHVQINKSATPNSNVGYHNEVTYTIVVSNDGGADALSTFVTDTLPGEVDFARWINQSGASMNADQLTWNGTIASGQSITFTLGVTHVGGYGDGVTNTAQFAQATGSGSSSAVFNVVSAIPNLTLKKFVSPNSNVAYHSEVTYTLLLTNSGAADATNTFITDTLPGGVTFARWIDQSGASQNANVITWNGTVTTNNTIRLDFVVTHTGLYGDVITNTAQFDQASGSGSASAAFSVEPLYPITFIYHDSEDVVLSGEPVSITTSFNGITALNADGGYTTFSNTVNLPAGVHTYRYAVLDHLDWLNTLTRSITVTNAATINDYRNVLVDVASLRGPSVTTTTVGVATENIFGRMHISGVTEPGGEGRGIHAQLGYGTDSSPTNWTWSNQSFDSQAASDDQFKATITPTSTGTYSYAVRFDGNWGAGNPNASWTYGDLDDLPFSIDQAGGLHVFNGPSLSIGKQVTPIVRVPRGGTVTYTIVLTNSGDLVANEVAFTDTLPSPADFSAWIISSTNTIEASDVITWSGSLQSGATISFSFTSIVTGAYASSVTNTASIAYGSAVTSTSAAFTFDSAPIIFNELDADALGTDSAEFIELYDGGGGNTSLNGLILAWFNGADSKIYSSTFNLSGYTTDANGYFVMGDAAITNSAIIIADNKLQNGPDAVALLVGKASDFPVGQTITNTDLSSVMDAMVYNNAAATAPTLLPLLNAGQTQLNENSRGLTTTQQYSLQRCPNGSGGARNTSTYYPSLPTPGAANACPVLSISKSASPNANVAFHSNVTYTMVLNNSGAGDALTTFLTDTLPGQVDFTRWINRSGANVAGDVITWSGEVTANQSITLTFVVTHVGNYGDVVTNTALFDHNTGSGSSAATFSVIPPTPNLHMSKSVSPINAIYHSNVTYTIVLSNNGTGGASNVLVTDTLPNQVDFDRWIDQSGASMNSDQITWSGAISIGQSITLTFIVTHVGTYGDVVTNTAQFDHPTGSGSASAMFSVGVPLLHISKSVSPSVNVPYHSLVTYTIVISNNGTSDAFDTSITDTLPSAVDFAYWIDQPTGGNANSNQVTLNTTAAVNQPITFKFAVLHMGSYGKRVTNTAQFDHVTGSGSGSAAFGVVPPSPNRTITKSVATIHNPVKLGDPITYTLVVSNNGAGDAISVLITDVLPSGVSGSNLNQTISISANQHVSLTIAGVVTSNVAYYGKSITNTAAFSHTSGQGSASAVIAIEPIPPANIGAIQFSTPNNQIVLPNSLVTYTIVLSNSGGLSATMRITDTVGSYYTVFNALNFTHTPTGTLRWTGVVTAGQSITLNFVARLKAVNQLPMGHHVLNNAATIDDGVHAPYAINSINPPWVDVYGVYLPLVKKNL